MILLGLVLGLASLGLACLAVAGGFGALEGFLVGCGRGGAGLLVSLPERVWTMVGAGWYKCQTRVKYCCIVPVVEDVLERDKEAELCKIFVLLCPRLDRYRIKHS